MVDNAVKKAIKNINSCTIIPRMFSIRIRVSYLKKFQLKNRETYHPFQANDQPQIIPNNPIKFAKALTLDKH